MVFLHRAKIFVWFKVKAFLGRSKRQHQTLSASSDKMIFIFTNKNAGWRQWNMFISLCRRVNHLYRVNDQFKFECFTKYPLDYASTEKQCQVLWLYSEECMHSSTKQQCFLKNILVLSNHQQKYSNQNL